MTTYAVVCDENLLEIFDPVRLDDDFSDISEIEQLAAVTAADGTKCCIRWDRSTDGQRAYWGPKGASIDPQWYVRRGRPALRPGDPLTERVELRCTKAQREKLDRLSGGDASQWMRERIDRARDPGD